MQLNDLNNDHWNKHLYVYIKVLVHVSFSKLRSRKALFTLTCTQKYVWLFRVENRNHDAGPHQKDTIFTPTITVRDEPETAWKLALREPHAREKHNDCGGFTKQAFVRVSKCHGEPTVGLLTLTTLLFTRNQEYFRLPRKLTLTFSFLPPYA